MRTRSQARRLRQQQLHQQQVPPNLVELPIVTMADNRTMAELLQAPTEGYEDAIPLCDVHGEGDEHLRHDDKSVTFKVGDTKNFSYNAMESVNKVDFIDIACEEYSQEILGIDDDQCDLEKDILLLEAILNSEPLSPLPNHANYFPGVRKELKICEAKTNETSIDEPPEVELKDLPPHLEYAFLEVPQGAIAGKLSDFRGLLTGILMAVGMHWTTEVKVKSTRKDHVHTFMDQYAREAAGAENLAADHLSRLENPHENKVDPKEINEKFPLETLSSIASLDASTPWFADIANYHAGNFVIKRDVIPS
ncbi:hypothetical protein Tco_0953719 [Tanacetum coccineum]|uniref:Reverse transcriptase domain-containing protein n=1 Tax=Tanacetum coccineum TaxID=301880 RepID=A0ABQ5E1P6_9ASTR